jgi:hypothetical protein
MSFPFHPIAPTSDAGHAEREEQEGPKTYDEGDFSDMEDSVGIWRAVVVLGALLLVEGLIFQNIVIGLTSIGAPPFLPLLALAAIIAIGLGGLAVAALGFGPEALACFGAAVVGGGVYAAVNGNAGGALPFSTDLVMFEVLLALGALLIAVGGVQVGRIYRVLSHAAVAG